MAYLLFGVDPRQCIGMRFALIEMKIMLTREYFVIISFYLVKNFITHDGTIISSGEIWIKLLKRQT